MVSDLQHGILGNKVHLGHVIAMADAGILIS